MRLAGAASWPSTSTRAACCAAPVAAAVPISAGALELLRRVLGGDLAAALRETPTESTHEVDTLAVAALEHHIERRLRAVGILGQV